MHFIKFTSNKIYTINWPKSQQITARFFIRQKNRHEYSIKKTMLSNFPCKILIHSVFQRFFFGVFSYISVMFVTYWRNIREALHWIQKVFDVYIPVCLCDMRQRSQNHSIRLKILTNVYMLCEISGIVFGAHCPNSACTDKH